MPGYSKNKRWLLGGLDVICGIIESHLSDSVLTVAPSRYINLIITRREIICMAPNIGSQSDYRKMREFFRKRRISAIPPRRVSNAILRFVLPSDIKSATTICRELFCQVFGFSEKELMKYRLNRTAQWTEKRDGLLALTMVEDQDSKPRTNRFYKVSITEIVSTPPSKIPKSKAIVMLPVREGNQDAAERRAGHIAKLAFTPLLRNKRVEKISCEVAAIDKPPSLPKMFSVIDGVTTWFTLDE